MLQFFLLSQGEGRAIDCRGEGMERKLWELAIGLILDRLKLHSQKEKLIQIYVNRLPLLIKAYQKRMPQKVISLSKER